MSEGRDTLEVDERKTNENQTNKRRERSEPLRNLWLTCKLSSDNENRWQQVSVQPLCKINV
jgi:hypothetical protein